MIWVPVATTTAGWLVAIAEPSVALLTLAALVTSLWQIKTEREARQRAEKRRQAERISGWTLVSAPEEASSSLFPWGRTTVEFLNVSEEPVYFFVAYLVIVEGKGPRTGLEAEADPSHGNWGNIAFPKPDQPSRVVYSVLPPGHFSDLVIRRPTRRWQRYGIELGFTDAGGRHWLRASSGELSELDSPAPEHYGIDRPINWMDPPHADQVATD